MKVKVVSERYEQPAGSVLDLDEPEARRLLLAGTVEAVPEPKKATKKATKKAAS